MMELFTVTVSLILTVVVGALAVILFRNPVERHLKELITFSGAFLLGVTLQHLIPEVYSFDIPNISYFVLVGFFTQIFLDYFSGGIDHGHFHAHTEEGSDGARFPIGLFLSLSIHSFLEGTPMLSHDHHGHHHVQDNLLVGIILHKLPIAVALTVILINSRLSKLTIVLSIVAFAIMSPLGTWTATWLNGLHGSDVLPIAMAIVLGMILHISTTILFETSDNHKFNTKKLIVMILGFALALGTL